MIMLIFSRKNVKRNIFYYNDNTQEYIHTYIYILLYCLKEKHIHFVKSIIGLLKQFLD